MLILQDPFVEKIHKHLESVGMKTEILPSGSMDFEYDNPRSSLSGPSQGIASMGSMRVLDGPITYLEVLKRKILEKSDFAPGGSYGAGVYEYTTWKFRFFISLPATINLGPLNIGTITKILKGKFHSKVEDFVWNGYGKLTTLPPGIVHDDMISVLNSDAILHDLMIKSLLKEKTISIHAYSPKKTREQTGGYQSFAKVAISSDWKPQHDMLIDKNTVETYQKIASDIRRTIITLRYVLENN
ncbi:MAG TPA: hypothetical protein VLB45_00065 [Nitrosopumilaceae archaeon]|nr:hypothetical protein [Nitrosopumilaceae archaeon]